MKRSLKFKAAKHTVRGTFFSFYWGMKMMAKFLRYLNSVKSECLRDMGNCPKCQSTDIEYKEYTIDNFKARIKFICRKCGKEGAEFYNLKYVKSKVKEVGDECRPTTVQQPPKEL